MTLSSAHSPLASDPCRSPWGFPKLQPLPSSQCLPTSSLPNPISTTPQPSPSPPSSGSRCCNL